MAYCTYAQVKTYLDLKNDTDETLIETLIERAQAAIEASTGRVFEDADAPSSRFFDAYRDVQGPTLFFDTDISTVTTVTNGDGTVLVEGADFVTEPRNETPYFGVRLLSSTGAYWQTGASTGNPEDAIEVEGQWVYSSSPPADIVHASIRLTGFFYRQKDAQVYDVTVIPELGTVTVPQGFPKDVEMLLTPYRRLVL